VERVGVAEGQLGGAEFHRGAGFFGQEAEQARQQLAHGQIAGRSEQDDHVVSRPGESWGRAVLGW